MSLNPWLALVVGALVGWLTLSLVERWYLRRRRSVGRRYRSPDASDRGRSEVAAATEAPPAPVAVIAGEASSSVGPSAAVGDVAMTNAIASHPAAEIDNAEVIDAGIFQDEHDQAGDHIVVDTDIEVSVPEVPSDEVNWPEVHAQVAAAAEVFGESAPASIASRVDEMPDLRAGLTQAHISDLAPHAVDQLDGGSAEKADDLTRIEGIGPVYGARLRTAGITTFAQLAETEVARLAEIIGAPAWRNPDFGAWIEQARLFAANDHEGVQALQARLFNKKRAPLSGASTE